MDQSTCSSIDQSSANKEAYNRLQQMFAVPPAQRNKDVYNPLEKIEELLTCPICLDRYRNPKLLPCQHTFCADPCLDGLVDIVRRVVKCPECRAEHSLPYDGVKAYQTNYTLNGFLEVHLQASEDNAQEIEAYIRRYNMERCKVCDEKAEVEYCAHCDKRICVDCKTSHMELIKRDLARMMNQIKRLSGRITEASDGLSKGMESLTMNCDNAKDEIKDYVRRYIKELKKKEERLTSEIETFYTAEIRLMRNLRDALELESSNVNEALARIEAYLKGEREINETDLCFYKQLFVDGLDYLRGFHPDADDLFSKKIRFSPGQDPNAVPSAILQFGELQICAPNFGGRWQQLEAAYVPRVFNVGLESDRYRVRNPAFDLNDISSWNQRTATVEPSESTNRRSTRSRHELLDRNERHTSEVDPNIRYRRRQQLEEEAWQRLRAGGESGGASNRRSPVAPRTLQSSPTTSGSDLVADTTAARSEPANRHVQRSPFVHINNETSVAVEQDNTTSQTEHTTAAATASSNTLTAPTTTQQSSRSVSPAKQATTIDTLMIQAAIVSESSTHRAQSITATSPTPPTTNVKQTNNVVVAAAAARRDSSADDNSLNEKVESIRREHEKNKGRKNVQSSHNSEHRKSYGSVDHQAGTAGVDSSEEDKSGSTDYQVVAVKHYPPLTRSHKANLASDRDQPQYPVYKREKTMDSTSLDWKKYLIPEPSRNEYTSAAGGTASKYGGGHEKTPTDYDDWNDRRRRFIRSKTNPEFAYGSPLTRSIDNTSNNNSPSPVRQDSTSATGGYRSRFLKNDDGGNSDARRNRYSTTRQDSNESSFDTDTNSRSDRKTRYRRKAAAGDRAQTAFDSVSSAMLGMGAPVANAHVNDSYRTTVPKIDYKNKGKLTVKFGAKGAGEAEFNWPRGVATTYQNNDIVVCDSSNHRVQIFSKRGQYLRGFGKYGSGKGEFDCLAGVACTRYGQLVITDRYNHRVQVFEESGLFVREFGQHGQTNGRFNNPWGVVVDQQGFIYVCDKDNHRVQIFQADGNFVGKFGTIGNRDGQFQNPHFIAVNKHNQLIVTDSSNHRVQVFDHNGHFLYSFGQEGFHDGQFKYPRGVAVDDQGFIIVADSGNNRIQIFSPDGRFHTTFGSWGSGESQLKGVEAVAVTQDGKIIVSDRENHRIQVF